MEIASICFAALFNGIAVFFVVVHFQPSDTLGVIVNICEQV